jgi:hypothetical protein
MPIRIAGKKSKRWRGYRAMRDGRVVSSKVRIFRSSQVGASEPFMACVSVGTGRTALRNPGVWRYDPKGAWQVCASGRNPRRALGRAFAKLGRGVSQRSGAFRGIK